MRCYTFFLLSLLIVLLSPDNYGQTAGGQIMAIHPDVQATWFRPDELNQVSFDWKAEWIWMDKTVESDVMLARRSFDLEGPIDEAVLRITASFQYQLYVNGEYVNRGPARSAPHHQSFDILNIENLLRPGTNTIAVRVHFQRGKYSYHHHGRAGLLAQLDMAGADDTYLIVSDRNWKVHPDLSWSNEAPVISRFQLFVNDLVDMRQALNGWQQPEFDDSSWQAAMPLIRHVGWPNPQKNAPAQALTPPWTALLPRDVPYLKTGIQSPIRLLDLSVASDTSNRLPINTHLASDLQERWKTFLTGQEALSIPSAKADQYAYLLVDFGSVHHGIPQLDIAGKAGTTVEVLCAPFVVQNQFTHQVVDSEFRDQLILSGKREQWEATYFKPTRFLAIRIHGNPDPVKIFGLSLRDLSYPFVQTGYMKSEDKPWIDAYMLATEKTIFACTTDALTDNYRERRQYAQTGYYGALGNYWTFGDHALQRRYLVQVAQEQQANGIMPAYAPLAKDDFMIILDSNCLWIRSLRNYLLYSGDRQTVLELLPAAHKLMDLLHAYTHEEGFLYNPPYAYWMDHALNDRRGANLCLNGHYLGALQDFSEVLQWLDKDGHARYSQRADQLIEVLREQFWNDEVGLFVDAWIAGEQSEEFSEHANAMALAMRIATSEQAKRVSQHLLEDDSLTYIRRASGMVMVTPAMSYFLHKGLCAYGYVDESFDLFRKRFDKMLADNTNGTLWEEWWLDGTGRTGKRVPKSRSDAQTESAFPPALFGEYLLGIQPTLPGWEEAEILYHPSSIRQIESNIPTPQGDLLLSWLFKKNNSGELLLEVPKDMRIKIDLAQLEALSKKDVQHNGQKIDLTSSESMLSVQAGVHRIQF
ncbi:MAG: family 78 glycoside hydrolase catalytic domain [Bacteroidota bacterium]